jgi:hypothetical protein
MQGSMKMNVKGGMAGPQGMDMSMEQSTTLQLKD